MQDLASSLNFKKSFFMNFPCSLSLPVICSLSLMVIFLLFSCQFKPVYFSDNTKNILCSIKIENETNSALLYEMDYKNELKSFSAEEISSMVLIKMKEARLVDSDFLVHLNFNV